MTSLAKPRALARPPSTRADLPRSAFTTHVAWTQTFSVSDGTSSLKLHNFSALIPPGLNTPGGNRCSARSVLRHRGVPEVYPLPSASTPLRAPTTAWPGARANRGGFRGRFPLFRGSRGQDEAARSSGQPAGPSRSPARCLPPHLPSAAAILNRHLPPPSRGALPFVQFIFYYFVFPHGRGCPPLSLPPLG